MRYLHYHSRGNPGTIGQDSKSKYDSPIGCNVLIMLRERYKFIIFDNICVTPVLFGVKSSSYRLLGRTSNKESDDKRYGVPDMNLAANPHPTLNVFVGHPTILVVDDDEDMQRLLSLILERAGAQVLSAYSGPQALQLATEHHPDVI